LIEERTPQSGICDPYPMLTIYLACLWSLLCVALTWKVRLPWPALAGLTAIGFVAMQVGMLLASQRPMHVVIATAVIIANVLLLFALSMRTMIALFGAFDSDGGEPWRRYREDDPPPAPRPPSDDPLEALWRLPAYQPLSQQ
jgi:hypothetical protein